MVSKKLQKVIPVKAGIPQNLSISFTITKSRVTNFVNSRKQKYQTSYETHLTNDRHTNQPTDTPTNQQSHLPTNSHTYQPTDMPTNKQTCLPSTNQQTQQTHLQTIILPIALMYLAQIPLYNFEQFQSCNFQQAIS